MTSDLDLFVLLLALFDHYFPPTRVIVYTETTYMIIDISISIIFKTLARSKVFSLQIAQGLRRAFLKKSFKPLWNLYRDSGYQHILGVP